MPAEVAADERLDAFRDESLDEPLGDEPLGAFSGEEFDELLDGLLDGLLGAVMGRLLLSMGCDPQPA
jgi:hypothetical protein